MGGKMKESTESLISSARVSAPFGDGVVRVFEFSLHPNAPETRISPDAEKDWARVTQQWYGISAASAEEVGTGFESWEDVYEANHRLDEMSLPTILEMLPDTFVDMPSPWCDVATEFLRQQRLGEARVALEQAADLSLAYGVLNQEGIVMLLSGNQGRTHCETRIAFLGQRLENAVIRVYSHLALGSIFATVGRISQAEDLLSIAEDVLGETVDGLFALASQPERLGFQLDFEPEGVPAFVRLARQHHRVRVFLNKLRQRTPDPRWH